MVQGAHAGRVQHYPSTGGSDQLNRVALMVSWKPTIAWRPGGTEPQHLAKAGPTRRTWRRSGTGRTAKGPKARAKKHRGKAPVKDSAKKETGALPSRSTLATRGERPRAARVPRRKGFPPCRRTHMLC